MIVIITPVRNAPLTWRNSIEENSIIKETEDIIQNGIIPRFSACKTCFYTYLDILFSYICIIHQLFRCP